MLFRSHSSWTRAAQHFCALACSLDPQTYVQICGTDLTLSVTQLKELANGENHDLLCRLVALPCTCKAKTTVVPSVQLTCEQVALLDITPFGAKIVKAQDITLGLPLMSAHTEVLPRKPDGTVTVKKRHLKQDRCNYGFKKAFVKIRKRSHAVQQTLTSGPKRVLFWTTFCLSTLYYFTSLVNLTAKSIRALLTLQSKTLLGRPWIPKCLVAHL